MARQSNLQQIADDCEAHGHDDEIIAVDTLALLLDCPAMVAQAECDTVRSAEATVATARKRQPFQPQVGDRVQRRSGSRNAGEVVGILGDRVRVRWDLALKSFRGEDRHQTVWTTAAALKPAGQMSDHAAWCRAQGAEIASLIKQAVALLPEGTRGTIHLAQHMGMQWDEFRRRVALNQGKVRAKADYKAATQALRLWIAAQEVRA